MDLIPSFSVDHTKIVPGIFISRQDSVGGEIVTTYDVRVTRPNIEPAVDVAAMHSLEHIIATFLRNDPEWKDEVIYWGPMGCLTGFYLLIRNADHTRVQKEIQMVLKNIIAFEGEIYGASEVECGNYRFHNLEGAKKAAEAFGRVMENPAALVYPI